MSDDIVDKLRDYETQDVAAGYLMAAAADEIERLRRIETVFNATVDDLKALLVSMGGV